MKEFTILIPKTVTNGNEIQRLKERTDILTIIDVMESNIVNEQNEPIQDVYLLQCETLEDKYLIVKEIMGFTELIIKDKLYLM